MVDGRLSTGRSSTINHQPSTINHAPSRITRHPMPILDLNTLFGFWPRDKVDLSVDVLVGAMRARGVVRSAAYSAKALFYDAGEGNDDTATVCGARPELIPSAVIDPRE